MKTKNSIFSNAVKVIYLQEDDEEYSKLSKMFKIHGYAFIANSYIFVDIPSLKRDGWLKKEYLQFIESHEISHKILKHKDGKRSAVQEAEADYLGVRLCQDKGFRSAAKVGIKHFKDRNRISFKEYHEKFGEKIVKMIK